MATFTALVKIYSTEYYCNTKVAGLGEIFVKRKFSCILYSTDNRIIILHLKFQSITYCTSHTKSISLLEEAFLACIKEKDIAFSK